MTKAQFLTELCCRLKDDDCIWVIDHPLEYYCLILDKKIVIPEGFETDLASVPRVPFIYMFWGSKAHREAVLHDYLYRIDAIPKVTFSKANDIFLEAMEARGKPVYVRYPMYWGVKFGGKISYHKKYVNDKLGG